MGALGEADQTAPPRPAAPVHRPAAVVAEIRLVSVLFADLVGFTALSESRDPEEVRELLSRYFDVCRELIERYGGTVEKFIGDAVMAVWGAPAATEDDAERAVRTALELVAAVASLGAEVGAPDPARPGGSADRRGSGDARRNRPGHGRRGPGEHRVPFAGRCRAGQRCWWARRRCAPPARRSPSPTSTRSPSRARRSRYRSGRRSEWWPSAEGWADQNEPSRPLSAGRRSSVSSRSYSTPPFESSVSDWCR